MLEEAVIARARTARRRALWAIIAVATTLIAPQAWADDPFQLRYNVERGGAGPVRVQGTVVNEARSDVHDVYVTVEALDAAGKVVGRGIAFVSAWIPQRGSAPFTISIPAAQAATSFRVGVSSFRYGAGQQTS